MENLDYLIIGYGRVGQHLARYFRQLKLQFEIINRETPVDTRKAMAVRADRILLCVPDRMIAAVAAEFREYSPRCRLVHFSGALVLPDLLSAHPLAALSDRPLTLEEYKSIHFAVEPGSTLSDILPGLPNPSFAVPKESRALYHCLCVLLANGTTVLWEKSREQIAVPVPSAALMTFLQNISANLAWGMQDGHSVLTGPWVRGDQATIQSHHKALSGSSLLSAYDALKNLAGGSI